MSELKSDAQIEIGHVLFMDIVEYSKLPIEEQSELLHELNDVVRETEQFRSAEASGKLIRLPTGDGMALVFFSDTDAPVRCALEVSKTLRERFQIRLRMGIHSGPVNRVSDVNDRSNVAGAGIDMARRVMDCGDAGHILVSKRVADDLVPYKQWRSCLHDLGEVSVKHDARVSLFNLFDDTFGNPRLPEKIARGELRPSTIALRRPKRLVLFAALGLFVAGIATFLLLAHHSGRIIDKSIAVLPFENLSDDKENAYFAGGIQDDVLTNLAKIGDLKVISRTSVAQYRSKAQNVREIGKALGVAAVLEGSVRRVGNRVRVNVQLIDTSNDQHLWAEDFDRDLTDVFAIQSDLALQIASALQTKLSSGERALLQRKPTGNAEAYLVYLQARDLWGRIRSLDDFKKAGELYKKAVQLDPQFALALARLSHIESALYYNYDPFPGRLDRARAAANEALRLQPELPEAHLALGYIYYWGERDYDRALAEFAIAKTGLPNDADVFLALGAIERRQGKWSQAISHQEKAASLNPKDAFLWFNIAGTYAAIRQFADATKAADRGCAINPSFFAVRVLRAGLDIESKGDTNSMDQLLARNWEGLDVNGQVSLARFQLKMLQRKYVEALQIAASGQADSFQGWTNVAPVPRSFLLGQAYWLAKEQTKAREAFGEAKRIVQGALTENPLDASRHALLGEIHANLGEKESALREGKRAVELLPETKDAVIGPFMTLALARIYTRLGDVDSALPLLEHSLSSPCGVNVPVLRLDPVWDPLRSDPRFEKLLAKFAAPLAKS